MKHGDWEGAAVLADGDDVPYLLDLQADLRDGKVMWMRRSDNDTEAYLRATILPRAEVVALVRAACKLVQCLLDERHYPLKEHAASHELRNAITPALRRPAEEGGDHD